MADKIEIKALIRPDLDTGGVVKKVSTIQSLLKKIDLPPTLQKEFNGLFNDFNDNIDKINNAFSKGFETKGSVKSLNSLTSHMEKITDKIIAKWNQASSNEGFAKQFSPEIASQIDNIDKEIKDLRDSITKLNAKPLGDIKQMVEELKGQGAKKTGNQVASLLDQGDLKQAIGLLTLTIEKRKSLNETMFKGAAKTTLENDNKALEKMLNALVEIDEKSDALKKIEDLKTERISKMADLMASVEKACQEAGVDVATLGEYINKTSSNIDDAAASTQQFTSEVDEIKDRIKYFFSLNNAIQLVRQALRQTFEAAKELDAAMTETAVVTDFSVGDMWDMLPKYTKTAQELGATTKGVYETLTLFYQQGLDTNEAIALGTETLKMARIAGMDYEEATSKMTAALRGFNMELNELSAQRVNDVYSELAAITAADTDQIATAMTKTASIANSANMEFETTAAFLSQIIETTQESAETAGTAMKTVIARFTELKKDPSLIGEVDGEVIDANKIETALNSIGVALRDNLTGQFRDLDDVFLDIAQKWEGLDTNTQRYIATIAAGSRQQSRFIAMMSDYERTMELVTAANDSAGSSQAQFDKTLESMEAKLNQLKNTWQEFTLGLMDQGILKEGIEALNGILGAINKITNLPGILGGASKALLGFFTLFTGKKLFGALSKSVIPNLVGQFTGAGVQAGVKFSDAMTQEFEGTKTLISKFFGTNLIDPQTVEGFKQLFNQDMSREALDTLAEIGPAYKLAEKSKQGMALVESDLMKITGLSNVQAKEALAMTKLGIPIDAASAAAKQGVTAAIIAEEQSQGRLNKENEEALRVELMKLTAEKTSLLTKAKSVAVLLFSTNTQKRETAAKILNIGATKGAIVAQLGLNAATAAFPIGWIVAGLAAVAAGLYLLIKWAKDNSLEGRLEKTEKSIDEFNEAISESQQRVQDLKQDWEALINTEQEIDKLTKGTVEWKKALFDANEQVLLLLEKYPLLKNYVSVGENGQIKIEEEGYNQLLENQVQGLSNLQAGQAVEEFKKWDIQGKLWENKIFQAAKVSSIESANKEDLGEILKSKNFANLLPSKVSFEEIDIENDDEIKNIMYASGLGSSYIKDNENNLKILKQNQGDLYSYDFSKLIEEGFSEDIIFDALGFDKDNINLSKDYQRFQMDRLVNEKIYASNLLTAKASQELLDSSIGDDLIDIFSESLSKESFTESAIKEKASTIDPEQFLRDEGLSIDSDNLSNLRKMYSKLSGVAPEDISEGWSTDDLKEKIATIQLGESAGKELNQTYEKLSKNFDTLTTGYQEQVEALISLDEELTTEEIQTWFKEDGSFNLESMNQSIADFEAKFGSIEVAAAKMSAEVAEQISNTFAESSNSLLLELGEGKTLSEIDPEKLTSVSGQLSTIKGLYDENKTAAEEWADLTNKGSVAQAEYLLNIQQSLRQSANEEQIQAAKKYQEEIEELQSQIDNPELGFDTKKAEEQLLKMQQDYYELLDDIELNPIEVDLAVDGILGYTDSITSALSVIDEGFKTNRESFEDLMETFPEVLNGATVLANGEIQLNEQVLKSAVEKRKGEIESSADAQIAQIKDAIESAIAQRNALQATYEFMSNTAVKSAILQGKSYEEILAAAGESFKGQSIAGGLAYQAIKTASQSAETQQTEDSDEVGSNLTQSIGQADEASWRAYGNMIDYTNKYRFAVNDAVKSVDALARGDVNSIVSGYKTYGFVKGTTKTYTSTNEKKTEGLPEVKLDIPEEEIRQTLESVFSSLNMSNDYYTTRTEDENYKNFLNGLQVSISDFDNLISSYSNQIIRLEAGKVEASTALDRLVAGGTIKGDSKGSSGSDKDESWEYERDYDENIKSQINAADKKLSKLEAEFEGLLNDENATLEDMIAKKLEMAAVDEEKIKLIEQQIELDRAEIEKLNKQHPEWADLVYVDENGAFQVDKDKVNAQGFNKEQGEEFEKWVQEQTAAHENLLSSSLDMVTTINEAAERLKIITNEFDQIYNNELKIEGLQRKRSKLETEYNELLEKNNNNVQGLVDNLSEQYDSLKEEQKLLEQNHNLSQLQLDSFLGSSKNQAFQDYYSYDKETNSFEINVEAMEKLAAFDEELYNVVSDFLETAMGYWEDNIEWEEKLLDNTEAIAKKQKEAEESFDNLQIRLYDEIINYMEQEIEAVEELYSSINDSNERILDSINESLAQQRQDRQNAETESEINDMRNRLAYLQMDTSGANQNEILNLQKQIREKEQDYTDTLIDQKIDELQKQNDFAAEQRERQIQLLQQEHEEAQLNGSYLKSAKEALDSLLVNNGDLNKAFYGTIGKGDENSPLKKIFPNGESVGKIISDNLLADTGKMPTQSQTDENTLTIGDQVAKALVRIQELRSTPNADISRTVLRVASGLDKVSDLDYYIYDLDKDGKVTEEDARLWLKGAVGLAAVPKYATGGLADFTGPAWLDGTKSRPELVLNQRDTQNFLQLKDILASFMSNNGSLQNSAENRGDNYYEIHLNVEKITSDYDVEQLANKVKSIIAEDANSRGVNSIYRRR